MISDAFDPALLRTFVAICHHGSLSRAATHAGRKQSALSAQIRRLEDVVGQRLLHRTGRGVIPTTEGELLLSYAKRILALGEAAAARLNERAVAGSVRIGLSEDVAIAALPAALGRLRRIHPHLHLDITVDDGAILGERWKDGAFDIAVAASSAFSAEPLRTWDIELNWACAIDLEIDPSQPLDVIVYAEPCSWRRVMFDALAKAGRDYRVAVTSSNVGAIKTAVESGLGVALLTPESMCDKTMKLVSLSRGESYKLAVNYGLFAVKTRNAYIQATIDLLHQGLRELARQSYEVSAA
jgi:DNA-binding transcriptional LysR family regulator